MDKSRERPTGKPEAAVAEAWQGVGASFERFCLTAGVSALRRMMEHDAALAELQGQNASDTGLAPNAVAA